jgi:hypothetical protein
VAALLPVEFRTAARPDMAAAVGLIEKLRPLEAILGHVHGYCRDTDPVAYFLGRLSSVSGQGHPQWRSGSLEMSLSTNQR